MLGFDCCGDVDVAGGGEVEDEMDRALVGNTVGEVAGLEAGM